MIVCLDYPVKLEMNDICRLKFIKMVHESYDARSADIWSLGVILLNMCIGTKLYDAPTIEDKNFEYIYGKVEESLSNLKQFGFYWII